MRLQAHVDADGGGEFAFGAVQGGLDCHFGTDSIPFTGERSNDMDYACGDAGLEEDGALTGEILLEATSRPSPRDAGSFSAAC